MSSHTQIINMSWKKLVHDWIMILNQVFIIRVQKLFYWKDRIKMNKFGGFKAVKLVCWYAIDPYLDRGQISNYTQKVQGHWLYSDVRTIK